MLKVVNMRDPEVKVAVRNGDPRVLYCGRAHRFLKLPASKWANPFHISEVVSRDEAIAKYEYYLFGRPDLLAALPELDSVEMLACWCAPEPCHCDVIKRLYEENRHA